MESTSIESRVYDRCLLLSLRCAMTSPAGGKPLVQLVEMPAFHPPVKHVAPPPGLSSLVSAETVAPSRKVHRSSPPPAPLPAPASAQRQSAPVVEEQVQRHLVPPLSMGEVVAPACEQHQAMDDDQSVPAEAATPSQCFHRPPPSAEPVAAPASAKLQSISAVEQNLHRLPASPLPVSEFVVSAPEQHQLVDDEQRIKDGEWFQVAHRATRKNVGNGVTSKKTSKLSKPKTPVALANPLPQKGKSALRPPRILVAGLVVGGSQIAKGASGSKWLNGPSQEAEIKDPDLACYLWDRNLQRPKASRRGIF